MLIVSDSRLNKRAANYHFKAMKKVLKGYSMIAHSTTRSSYIRRGGARMNTMGGTLFILSPRCATNIVDTGDDGSGIGIAGYVCAIIGGTKYCLISIYQPIGGEAAGELLCYPDFKLICIGTVYQITRVHIFLIRSQSGSASFDKKAIYL